MADIEVYGADTSGTSVTSLRVRFKGTAEQVIPRATALVWLAEGHSMLTYAGSAHHGVRGLAIQRVEAGGDVWLRTDTKPEAADHLEFPHGH